jgi:hypothetical protein
MLQLQPCSRSHNQARPEATFYRDADEYRYKMCMTCLDRERKRDRGKEDMARVTNTEYDFMFLQPIHWSSALTFFATHGLCAKSATHSKKIHVTPSSAFASIPSNNTMNDNQRKHVRSTPTTTSSNITNTSKTTDTMAQTTSPSPDRPSASSSVPNDDVGQVVAGTTFPCSGCRYRQRPEASFYRDANGNPYKRCIKCTDRRRKGGKGGKEKGAVAGATNDEYAAMFLQTTHLSKALTVFATSHRVTQPATSTEKAEGTTGAKTTDKMKPSASTVSSPATNQVVYPLLGSDDDHPQLSTDLLALISELAVVIGASSAVTIITLTREVTKAIEEIQEELWEVRNVYAAPLGMRMPAKALGRMVAPLLNSVRTVLRAELRKTLLLRRQPGGLGTGRKAWVNLIARSLAKRLTDQLVAEAPAGNYPPSPADEPKANGLRHSRQPRRNHHRCRCHQERARRDVRGGWGNALNEMPAGR